MLWEDMNDFYKSTLTALKARNEKATRGLIEQDVDIARASLWGNRVQTNKTLST